MSNKSKKLKGHFKQIVSIEIIRSKTPMLLIRSIKFNRFKLLNPLNCQNHESNNSKWLKFSSSILSGDSGLGNTSSLLSWQWRRSKSWWAWKSRMTWIWGCRLTTVGHLLVVNFLPPNSKCQTFCFCEFQLTRVVSGLYLSDRSEPTAVESAETRLWCRRKS